MFELLMYPINGRVSLKGKTLQVFVYFVGGEMIVQKGIQKGMPSLF